MAPRCIQQHACADDVGMNKVLWRIDAAIDMRFGGEIDDGVKLMLGHQRIHLVGIGDIGFEKFVMIAIFLGHAGEVGNVARISQRIDICYVSRLVMFQNVANKVAADEAAAARH